MKFNLRKILKISLLFIAFAMSMAILSACNGLQSTLPSEHFEGNCITKGYTRYYKPNGTYIDRLDAYFGDHSYDEGTTVSERSCTVDGVTKYVCTICSNEDFKTEEKFGHDYKKIAVADPTCTDDGHADFMCSRCDETRSDVLDKLGHDFKVTVTRQPSCSEKGSKDLDCKRCEYSTTADIPKLDHVSEKDEFDDSEHWSVCVNCKERFGRSQHVKATSQIAATCVKHAFTQTTCRDCKYSVVTEDKSIPLAPHDYVARYDGEGHWNECSVCENINGYSKHSKITARFDSTCIRHAYQSVECSDCDYYHEVEDEFSPLKAHSYEAYTCLTCQRDKMLDFKSEFDSRGANVNNLINITSEEMFVCFYDYLIVYQITDSKYIKITYTTLYKDEINSFLTSTRRKLTATNWSVKTKYSYNQFTSEVTYLYMNAANADGFVFDEVATYTPDEYPDNYKRLTYKQYQSYQFVKNDARPSGFDDFAYKSRLYEMNVSSSDQLFFAFEHGYKPKAAPGSAAEKMLGKAKAVARRIMNDGMSELEKMRAIYSYLVSDVAYDYGIVEMTNDKNGIPYAKCAAYYLEGVFDYNMAVCDGISKAYCVLAGLEDIKCVRVTSENHAWNKLYIDVNGDGEKSWFASDATWGNQGILYNSEKGEYLSVEDFLFTDAQKRTKDQIGKNYIDTNSDATTAENPFEYFYFDEAEDGSCDFVITSGAELSALIQYLKASFNDFKKGDIITVNIFIVSTYIAKDNITKTLQNELSSQWFLVGATSALTVSDNETVYGAVKGYSVSIIIPKL